MALYLELEVGEGITIGAGIKIKLEQKTGRKVRLRIEADRLIPVKRFGEVCLPPVDHKVNRKT